MVGLTIGGLRKTGRRKGKATKRIGKGSGKTYYKPITRRSIGPGYSPSFRVSMLPATQTITFRQTIVDSFTIFDNATRLISTSLQLPFRNTVSQNDVFAGGLLPYFHLYDKAMVIQSTHKTTISTLGVFRVTNGAISYTYPNSGAAMVVQTTVPWEQSNQLQQNYTKSSGYELVSHLRDMPNSSVKSLGNPNSGHDTVVVHSSVDHERFVGQPLDASMALRRKGDTICYKSFGDAMMATTPAIFLAIIPETSREAQLQAGSNIGEVRYEYRLEQEILYTIQLSDLRAMVAHIADMTALSLYND